MSTAAFTSLLLLLLFLLLDLTRRHIITQIHHLSLLLTGHTRPGIYLYSLIFLPGVITHELSHLIFALVLRVPAGRIEIFPSFEAGSGEVKLGYVQIAKTDFIRRSLIGAAPTIVGIIAIYAIATLRFSFLLTPADLLTYWQLIQNHFLPLDWFQLTLLYLIFTIASTMFTSRQDRDAWPILGIFLIIITLLLSFSGLINAVGHVLVVALAALTQTIGASLLLALVVNVLVLIPLILLQKILSILTGKHIAVDRSA